MSSARDFDIFKSKAFTSKKHESGLPKDSGFLSQKLSVQTVASNGSSQPFAYAIAGYETGIAGERNMRSLDGTTDAGDEVVSKEVPSVGTNTPSITPNVLEARVSHKHLGKTISEKHTSALVTPATQKQQSEGYSVKGSDSSSDDDENTTKPPHESARKRADKAAFSEW